ncbi:MAG: hypothetical protein AAF699_00305 [Pseudomonadota bacterium]
MLKKLNRQIGEARFNSATKRARRELSLELDGDSSFTIVTMLRESDVNMYLLALASFCRFKTPKSVVVVSDGLSGESIEHLSSCVPGIQIRPVHEFTRAALPSGGCWERLISITSLNTDHYVVQLDADTLTLDPPEEVIDAIESNVSFTLSSRPGCSVMSFPEASQYVEGWDSQHVQVVAESAFYSCKDAIDRSYVRGCAAFTGFAMNTASLEKLESFSLEIENTIGRDKWREWGSEQVASNYLVADSAGCVLLPFEKYPFYSPNSSFSISEPVFYHFIGSHRFKKGKYKKLAASFLDSNRFARITKSV